MVAKGRSKKMERSSMVMIDLEVRDSSSKLFVGFGVGGRGQDLFAW